MRLVIKSSFISIFGGLLSSSLFATTLDFTTLQANLNQSDAVFEIIPISKNSYSHSEWGIETIFECVIQKITRKKDFILENVGDRIQIHLPGGILGNEAVVFPGVGSLKLEKPHLVYLKQTLARHYRVVGQEKGIQPLFSERKGSRNRTDGSNGQGTGPFLYWSGNSFPIPYFISLPSLRGYESTLDAIDSSFSTWKRETGSKVDFIAMGCNDSRKNQNDGINQIIFVRSGWNFDSAAIAVTRNFYVAGLSSDTGRILDSDILFNAENYQFSINRASGTHDIQNILTHEIGHFLGFGHEVTPEDSDATMYSTAASQEVKKRILKANDKQILLESYPGAPLKTPTYPTSASCPFSNQNSGCASAAKQKPNPFWVLWLGLFLVGFIAIRYSIKPHSK